MEETNQSPFYGKPWNITRKFRTYEQAFAEVQQIILEAAESGKVVKTKIKRAGDGRFVIKTPNETVKLVPEKKQRKYKKKKT